MKEIIIVGVVPEGQFEPLIVSPLTGFVNGLFPEEDPCSQLSLTYRSPDPYQTQDAIDLAQQNGKTPCLQVGDGVLEILSSELTFDAQAGPALGLIISLDS